MIDQKWIDKYPHLFGPGAKDPDEGKGEIECDDAIARVAAKFTGIGGTFSTWSERHCFTTAASIGYTCVEHTEDVPPVPLFWIGEGHYWISGIAMGRAARKVEEAASKTNWTPVFIAIISGLTAGTAYGPQILKIIGIA